jgi:hypothetical protein
VSVRALASVSVPALVETVGVSVPALVAVEEEEVVVEAAAAAAERQV